jgi:hypothetical protein
VSPSPSPAQPKTDAFSLTFNESGRTFPIEEASAIAPDAVALVSSRIAEGNSSASSDNVTARRYASPQGGSAPSRGTDTTPIQQSDVKSPQLTSKVAAEKAAALEQIRNRICGLGLGFFIGVDSAELRVPNHIPKREHWLITAENLAISAYNEGTIEPISPAAVLSATVLRAAQAAQLPFEDTSAAALLAGIDRNALEQDFSVALAVPRVSAHLAQLHDAILRGEKPLQICALLHAQRLATEHEAMANLMINSSLPLLIMRLARRSRSREIQELSASLLGELIKQATFISPKVVYEQGLWDTLASLVLRGPDREGSTEDGARPAAMLRAQLGACCELLFYIVTQADQERLESQKTWAFPRACREVIVFAMKNADPQISRIASITISNVASLTPTSIKELGGFFLVEELLNAANKTSEPLASCSIAQRVYLVDSVAMLSRAAFLTFRALVKTAASQEVFLQETSLSDMEPLIVHSIQIAALTGKRIVDLISTGFESRRVDGKYNLPRHCFFWLATLVYSLSSLSRTMIQSEFGLVMNEKSSQFLIDAASVLFTSVAQPVVSPWKAFAHEKPGFLVGDALRDRITHPSTNGTPPRKSMLPDANEHTTPPAEEILLASRVIAGSAAALDLHLSRRHDGLSDMISFDALCSLVVQTGPLVRSFRGLGDRSDSSARVVHALLLQSTGLFSASVVATVVASLRKVQADVTLARDDDTIRLMRASLYTLVAIWDQQPHTGGVERGLCSVLQHITDAVLACLPPVSLMGERLPLELNHPEHMQETRRRFRDDALDEIIDWACEVAGIAQGTSSASVNASALKLASAFAGSIWVAIVLRSRGSAGSFMRTQEALASVLTLTLPRTILFSKSACDARIVGNLFRVMGGVMCAICPLDEAPPLMDESLHAYWEIIDAITTIIGRSSDDELLPIDDDSKHMRKSEHLGDAFISLLHDAFCCSEPLRRRIMPRFPRLISLGMHYGCSISNALVPVMQTLSVLLKRDILRFIAASAQVQQSHDLPVEALQEGPMPANAVVVIDILVEALVAKSLHATTDMRASWLDSTVAFNDSLNASILNATRMAANATTSEADVPTAIAISVLPQFIVLQCAVVFAGMAGLSLESGRTTSHSLPWVQTWLKATNDLGDLLVRLSHREMCLESITWSDEAFNGCMDIYRLLMHLTHPDAVRNPGAVPTISSGSFASLFPSPLSVFARALEMAAQHARQANGQPAQVKSAMQFLRGLLSSPSGQATGMSARLYEAMDEDPALLTLKAAVMAV